MRRSAVAVAAAAVLTGCGDDGDTGTIVDPEPTTTQESTQLIEVATIPS
jgi:hypothetical protein